MNSLEFIEAKIKSTERRIQELRKDQSFAITHNREDEFLDLDSDIEYYENLLNHLQQIKAKLEAWEVVQGTIVEGQDGDGRYCYIETVYFTGEKGEKVTKGLYNDETR